MGYEPYPPPPAAPEMRAQSAAGDRLMPGAPFAPFHSRPEQA
jgi:hypothetical protein